MSSIFFSGRYDALLFTPDILHSGKNAVNLSGEWAGWLDDGRICLREWAGDVRSCVVSLAAVSLSLIVLRSQA